MARVVNVGADAMQSGKMKPIPAGTKVRVSVFDIKEETVKSGDNAGQPQLMVTLKVTEDGPYKGREIRYNYIPLYPSNASWKLVTFGQAVGWKAEGESVTVPDDITDVLGTELVVKVGVNDRDYNTVTGYAEAGVTTDASTQQSGPSWGNLRS